MSDFELTPPRPDQQHQPQNVERSEWTRRYAARVAESTGLSIEEAMHVAEVGADSVDDDDWTDPEGAALDEMSYWDDDEGGAA